jgi:uncharacterized membrane protein
MGGGLAALLFCRGGDSLKIGRLLMGALYIGAGAMHFVLTKAYMRVMPPYLPAHRELVLLSGAAEIAGGVGVLVPQTRRAAAWGLVALLVAVMPANIYMVQTHGQFPGIPLWALWARLPLQVLLILWAWSYARRKVPPPLWPIWSQNIHK